MRIFLSMLVAFCLAFSTCAAAAAPKKKHPALSKTAGHRAVKTTAGRKASGKRATARKGANAVVRYRGQTAPTADRLREIQGALAAKGYLKRAPSGEWDAESQEAMKRFQADSKLDQTGKWNSLSLIALGLGPKRDPAPEPASEPVK